MSRNFRLPRLDLGRNPRKVRIHLPRVNGFDVKRKALLEDKAGFYTNDYDYRRYQADTRNSRRYKEYGTATTFDEKRCKSRKGCDEDPC